MAEENPFSNVKLICGLIASDSKVFQRAEKLLLKTYGKADYSSSFLEFNFTDYYEKEMGKNLKRKFISFDNLYSPEKLSEIKIHTNKLEKQIKEEFNSNSRVVNIDPGYLTTAALIMATAKNFSHRIPLRNGIYAHLELLFGRKKVNTLSWTYPDYRNDEYQKFFFEVRKIYLRQLKNSAK